MFFSKFPLQRFDSAVYRKHDTKWHFSQPRPGDRYWSSGVGENATSREPQVARYEMKPL
jgi:hypothetical protein